MSVKFLCLIFMMVISMKKFHLGEPTSPKRYKISVELFLYGTQHLSIRY
jgi:hypothetical protein